MVETYSIIKYLDFYIRGKISLVPLAGVGKEAPFVDHVCSLSVIPCSYFGGNR